MSALKAVEPVVLTSVALSVPVAETLREFCASTGMSLKQFVRQAVERELARVERRRVQL